jgi:hypothetical protein
VTEDALVNLAATLAMFEPCFTQGVPDVIAQMNLEFLDNFAGIQMPERTNAPGEKFFKDLSLHAKSKSHKIYRSLKSKHLEYFICVMTYIFNHFNSKFLLASS